MTERRRQSVGASLDPAASPPVDAETTLEPVTPLDAAVGGGLPGEFRATAATSAGVGAGPSKGLAAASVAAPVRPTTPRPDPEWEAALARARWIARLGVRRRRPDGTREDWLEPAQRAELERRGRLRLAFYKAADAFAAREGRAPDKSEQRWLLAQSLAEEDAPQGRSAAAFFVQGDSEQARSYFRHTAVAELGEPEDKLLPDVLSANAALLRTGSTPSNLADAPTATAPPKSIRASETASGLKTRRPYLGVSPAVADDQPLHINEDIDHSVSVDDRRADRENDGRAEIPDASMSPLPEVDESRQESILSVDSIELVSFQAALRDLDFDENGASTAFDLIELIGLRRAWSARNSGKDTLSHVETRFEEEIARAVEHRLPARRIDAYRHAYWSFVMTRDLGAEIAKEVGDTHERRERNPDRDLLMDLYNNRVGRELALDPRNAGRTADEVVGEALEAGLLRTFPFDVYYGPE